MKDVGIASLWSAILIQTGLSLTFLTVAVGAI